jgi:hypothetical protein
MMSPNTIRQIRVPASCCVALLAAAPAAQSADTLDRLRISEVVKTVRVSQPDSKSATKPKVNDTFGAPEIMDTGDDSRAEMVAPDGTVTRVGSNSVFYFSPNKRELNLRRGTVLFHSPTGKGGGVIRSTGAMAGVVGTSIIVSATKNGGFKLLVLEGKAKATLTNGTSINVGAGQMTFVMPGSRQFGPLVSFRLKDQIQGSNLVKGFKAPLSSLSKINEAVATQERKIASGRIESTDFLVDDTNLVQVVAASALGRARLTDAENISGGSLAKASGIDAALGRDLEIRDGKVDPSHRFIYRNADIPPALMKLLGNEFQNSSVRYSPDYVHAYIAGNNVNLLGAHNDELFPDVPSSVEGFVVAAQKNLTFNEGLAVGLNAGLSNPISLMDAHPSTDIATDKSLWAVAGSSISISDSLLAGSSNWAVFGNYYEAYPNIDVSVTNSAILNYYTFGGVNLGGNTVKVTNSNIVSRGSVTIYAGAIEIDSATGRSIVAGYRSPGETSSGSGFHSDNLLMKADRDLKIKNSTLSSNSVALDAATLVLENVSFKAGSVVSLVSGNGSPNFGAVVKPFYVNFVGGVTHGETQITAANQVTVTNEIKTTQRPTAAGIYLYKNNPQ